jgi:hypothetical protein
MTLENRQILNETQKYVMHLRYKIAEFEIDGIDPPQYFLDELEVAERLVRLGSSERE